MELTQTKKGNFVMENDPGEPSTGQPRQSVTTEEAKVLAAIARDATVLEIGTGLGVSAKAMADAGAFVTTYDIDEWVHENVFPTLGSVRTVVNLDVVATDKFDVIFIDAAHDQQSVTRDLEIALSLLKKGGVILLHDFKESGVHKAVFQMGLTAIVIETTHQIGMVFP